MVFIQCQSRTKLWARHTITSTTKYPVYRAILMNKRRQRGGYVVWSMAMFILWCILGFLLALLAIVAGVFGSMLARQSSEILDLKNVAATKTTGSDTNGTSTTAAPAATMMWVQVVDWEYIGYYEDTSNRVFPDKYTHIEDQTNRLCAAVSSDYEYFGTEFGDQCYCSRTPPTSEIFGGYLFLSA
ncbi:hypothetical protein CSAL01_04666 [Colletotrichum salicis]|uniref:WSC domain-containing protein n=1 Tax=Colletotrichum salicis TaxID=1209931 RepID=A0A135UW81_9PEZI|nr:hypothetical protein CSAL01_04666 [Colletotrichum salicis]